MHNVVSQYQHSVIFSSSLPDEATWEVWLLEMGLAREAFSILRTGEDSGIVKFWEPDRFEAIRLIARLETMKTH